MKKVLILGNSGSGKTTLARQLAKAHDLAYLDLDGVAWLKARPPQRQPLDESAQAITAFIRANQTWVIEGCYADLIDFASPASSELIFLNIPAAVCAANVRARQWEPQKYATKAQQDEDLAMLLDWIAAYPERDDVTGQRAHQQLFAQYSKKKNRRSEMPER